MRLAVKVQEIATVVYIGDENCALQVHSSCCRTVTEQMNPDYVIGNCSIEAGSDPPSPVFLYEEVGYSCIHFK
jgi:hypothetical protein